MLHRYLSVFGLILLVLSTGCIEDPAPYTGTDPDDGLKDAGDGGAQTDASGEEDDGGMETPDCVDSAMDCPAVDNATASCVMGACEYACDGSYSDADGDLQSNGCECEILGDTDDTCDGVDDDCDGVVDDEAAAVACPNQEGVCAGSKTACTGGNEQCTEADYASHSAAYAIDEGWRCDGLDNDCDSLKDKPCCGTGETPMLIEHGSTPKNPAIAPAAAGGPADAAYLLAWSEGASLTFEFLDVEGAAVGTAPSAIDVASSTDLQSVALTATSDGYFVATSYASTAAQEVVLFELDSDGAQVGTAVKLDDTGSATKDAANVDIASDGTDTCATWTRYTGSEWEVVVECFSNDDPLGDGDTPGAIDTNAGGQAMPAIAVAGGRFGVAWWETGSPKSSVFIETMAPDGSNRSSGSVQTLGSFNIAPLSIAGANAEFVVVHSKGDSSPPLQLSRFDAMTAEQVGTTHDITSSKATQPAAAMTDADRDGTDDTLVVAWKDAGNPSRDLVVGAVDPKNPMKVADIYGLMSDNFAHTIGFAKSQKGLGAVWKRGKDSAVPIQFSPVSFEGVPICEP